MQRNRLLIRAGILILTAGFAQAQDKTKKPPPAVVPKTAPPVKTAPPAPAKAPSVGTVSHTPAPGAPAAATTKQPMTTTPRITAPVNSNPSVANVPKSGTANRAIPGAQVPSRPGGRPGMDVHQGLNGNKRVSVVRGDRRIVAERGGRGYVERRFAFQGREYGHRSYYYDGRVYDRFYHGYPYHGVYLQMYTPASYYAPAFYGWAYNPWTAPVRYEWGWAGSPWSGYYGAYFAPYPMYPNASLWLTDYMIASTLAASYQAGTEAQVQQPLAGVAPLTPQVKNLIAAEVQRQIAVENTEAQPAALNGAPNPALSGIQAMFNDGVQHVFVAGRSIDVADASGAECAVTEGDVLQLAGRPAQNSTSANLIVLSNKGGKDCRAGAMVAVPIADLQEMENHMRETIDQGLGELRTKQASGGLPALPPSASSAPVSAPFVAAAPKPDPSAAAEIAQQWQAADQAEGSTVVQPIQLGQGIAEVTGIIGRPNSVAELGEKKIYFYPGLKITFHDGKVVAVQ